ncbi:MAG: CFI-box-CTERM domain-containing protein, partial [Kofleriaceae bacterium]
NFDAEGSRNPRPRFLLGDAGSLETFTIDGLLPETHYSIGIRPIDNCHNAGPLTVIDVVTMPRTAGEVDWCFIATAAYGSTLAADVDLLRHVRDAVLSGSALGQLAISSYYTFSPSIAGIIGESELLRETTRGLLEPMISSLRGHAF